MKYGHYIPMLLSLMMAADCTGQDAAKATGVEDAVLETINPKLPPYKFVIESTGQGEVTIHISGGPRRYRGQTIEASVEDEKRPGFFFEDVNFDGYEDFGLVENRGATGNIDYEYWTFDPKKGVFKEAPDFDGITFVDHKNKTLVSHSKGGNILTVTEYYIVRNGRSLMLKSIRTLWSQDARDIVPVRIADGTPVTITRLYRNGKLYRTFYGTKNRDGAWSGTPPGCVHFFGVVASLDPRLRSGNPPGLPRMSRGGARMGERESRWAENLILQRNRSCEKVLQGLVDFQRGGEIEEKVKC